jgi:hypothetical protein
VKPNKTFIEKGDFIYYMSEEFPLVVLFGISHSYNRLFDMNVTGLLNIQDSFNEHLKHHPVDYKQEINMVRFDTNDLNISHMGFIYNSNEKIMYYNYPVGNGQRQLIYEMFLGDFKIENIYKKVNKWTFKMKEHIEQLFKEFLLVHIESNDFESILKPTDSKTERLKVLYDVMMYKMEFVVSNEERLREFEYELLQKTKLVLNKLNFTIEKLLIKPSVNVFFNSLIFDKPTIYFPKKVEVNGPEFTAKYTEIFLNKYFPEDQVDDIEGGFVELLRMSFEGCKVEYQNEISKLKPENSYDDIHQFNKSVDKLLTFLISPKSFLDKIMRLRINSALFYYMDRMMRFSQVRDTGVMIAGTRFVNIIKIAEIMRYFGPDRNVLKVGYPVSFELFTLQEKMDKQSLMRMDTQDLDLELENDHDFD